MIGIWTSCSSFLVVHRPTFEWKERSLNTRSSTALPPGTGRVRAFFWPALPAFVIPKHHMDVAWWVVSTHLKNMLVKLDYLPQIGVKIKNMWNHHLVANGLSLTAIFSVDFFGSRRSSGPPCHHHLLVGSKTCSEREHIWTYHNTPLLRLQTSMSVRGFETIRMTNWDWPVSKRHYLFHATMPNIA